MSQNEMSCDCKICRKEKFRDRRRARKEKMRQQRKYRELIDKLDEDTWGSSSPEA